MGITQLMLCALCVAAALALGPHHLGAEEETPTIQDVASKSWNAIADEAVLNADRLALQEAARRKFANPSASKHADRVWEFFTSKRVAGYFGRLGIAGEAANTGPKLIQAHEAGGWTATALVVGGSFASMTSSTLAGTAAAAAAAPLIAGSAGPIVVGLAVGAAVSEVWSYAQDKTIEAFREEKEEAEQRERDAAKERGVLKERAVLFAVSFQRFMKATDNYVEAFKRHLESGGRPDSLPKPPTILDGSRSLAVGTKLRLIEIDDKPHRSGGVAVPITSVKVRVLSGRHKGTVGWLHRLNSAGSGRWDGGPFWNQGTLPTAK